MTTAEHSLAAAVMAVETGSPGTRLIVLTFDHLPAAVDRFSAFELLDLRSAFYEQHYAQDVRSNVALLAGLGNSSDFEHLRQFLNSAGLEFRFFRLAGSRIYEPISDPGVLAAQQTTLSAVPADSEESLESLFNATVDVHLVWIHAQDGPSDTIDSVPEHSSTSQGVSGAGEHTAVPERLLRQVLQWQQRLSESRERPVQLLVTALRGAGRQVAAPFESLFADDRVHVPLWIDRGDHEFCRISSISGSFEILPTIINLLSGDASDSCRLLKSGVAPGALHPVTLMIRADDCEVLRTDSVLIVRQLMADTADMPADCSADPPVAQVADHPEFRYSLYLKPEDIWNVHEQSTVYQAILSEYIAEWPERRPVTSETL